MHIAVESSAEIRPGSITIDAVLPKISSPTRKTNAESAQVAAFDNRTFIKKREFAESNVASENLTGISPGVVATRLSAPAIDVVPAKLRNSSYKVSVQLEVTPLSALAMHFSVLFEVAISPAVMVTLSDSSSKTCPNSCLYSTFIRETPALVLLSCA